MLKLSPYELDMLNGAEGRLKQRAIENIARYAEILGADALCAVTKATVFCGRHGYLSAYDETDFDKVFSKVQLCTDEIIPFDAISPTCQAQSCVAPCDQFAFEPLGQSESFFRLNQHYLDRARDAGVTIAGTCAPYLNGWIPLPGEHFVTTESGMTILGNSLWGARCNSDGIEAAFWSAICGRTPLWGKHTDSGRIGNIAVEVNFEPKTSMDFDLLGKSIGDRLPTNAIPVITGNLSHLNFNHLRQMLTALAISSNCEMVHIPGVTYDARTVEEAFAGQAPPHTIAIGLDEVRATYEKACTPGESPVDFVSLGCPHYDIEQIRRVAAYIKGKHVAPGVTLQVWTSYPIKHMADVNGYLQTIRDAGGDIFTGTCPVTVGNVLLDRFHAMAFDSFKQSGSCRSSVELPIYLADMERCVDAAIAGAWKEANRWNPS